MYSITKTVTISAAHQLALDRESKCQRMHGHNWKITVTVCSENLNDEGMVVDFQVIKDSCMLLDHRKLNDFFPQPTAEHLTTWLRFKVEGELLDHNKDAFVSEITVEESDGNVCRLVLCE